MKLENKPNIIILCGVSGAGKHEIQRKLCNLEGYVSPTIWTTRKQLYDNEIESFVFCSEEQFINKMQNEDFCQYCLERTGRCSFVYTGISRHSFSSNGKHVVVCSPVEMAQLVTSFGNSANVVSFLINVGEDLAEERLALKRTSVGAIKKLKKEFEYIHSFSYSHMLNGNRTIDENVLDVINIINKK